MSQFLVPQFIEVEPKIIGPITVRQFIIMIVGFILIFVEYKLLSFWYFIGGAVLTFGIFGVLAFLKINGQPFHYFLLNVGQTLKRPKLTIWKKEVAADEIRKAFKNVTKVSSEVIARKKQIGRSQLEELSLIVNTGGVYQTMLSEEELKYEESEK
jgi:membrane-bound ClpP family serine protease